jgi:hypothetical protein
MTGFHFADVGESFGLLGADGIASGVSARSIHDGDVLVLLFDELGNVGGDFDVIVGVAHDDENVDFVAGIGLRIGLGLLCA